MDSGLDIFVTKSYVKNPSKQGAKVKKPQTEEKAKGLIGLNKGKKVSGAAYSVGNYKGKTLNLSSKDLGAAGRKAAANKVKIQDTNYDAASKKVMSGGKALTGKVDLGGGNMAVYRNGVRVRAAAKKVASGGGNGGGGGGGKNAASKSGKNIGYTPGAGGKLSQAMASKGAKNIGYTPGAGGSLSKASAANAKKSNLSTVQKASSGYVRGGYAKKAADGRTITQKGATSNLRRDLQIKRGQDTRNQGRDATVIAAMGLAPLALAGSGIAGATAAGRAAIAARGGVTAARAAGLRGVAGKAADKRLASQIKNYKPKPAAAKSTPKPAAKTTRPRPAKPAPLSKLKADEWDLKVVTKAGKRYASDQKAQTALDKQLAKGTTRQRAAKKGAETRARNKAAAADKKGKK